MCIRDSPWFLWTAQAERLVDLRDEEMVLREDDALGELPEDCLLYTSKATKWIVDYIDGKWVERKK